MCLGNSSKVFERCVNEKTEEFKEGFGNLGLQHDEKGNG